MITIDGVQIEESTFDGIAESLGWTRPQSKKRWRAENGGLYWTVNNYGNAIELHDDRDRLDNYSFISGDYHRTEAEAEQFRDRQLAKQRIIDYYREHETEAVDWGDEYSPKWCVHYSHKRSRFELENEGMNQFSAAELYTTSKEAAQYVCDNMQEALKLLLSIGD